MQGLKISEGLKIILGIGKVLLVLYKRKERNRVERERTLLLY
jgi:hypothetical protein